MTTPIRRLLAAAAAAALSAALLSCTGVGDGGVTASNQQLARGGTYTSSTLPPGSSNAVVYLHLDSGTRTTACLGVYSYYAQDLYSVAFTLQYDATVLRYTGYTEGTLLGDPGELLYDVSAQPLSAPDSVVVGISRSHAVTDTGVTGNGLLITLCFDLVGPATDSPVTFGGANLVGFNSTGTDPANPSDVAIRPADFYGGTITVQ